MKKINLLCTEFHITGIVLRYASKLSKENIVVNTLSSSLSSMPISMSSETFGLRGDSIDYDNVNNLYTMYCFEDKKIVNKINIEDVTCNVEDITSKDLDYILKETLRLKGPIVNILKRLETNTILSKIYKHITDIVNRLTINNIDNSVLLVYIKELLDIFILNFIEGNKIPFDKVKDMAMEKISKYYPSSIHAARKNINTFLLEILVTEKFKFNNETIGIVSGVTDFTKLPEAFSEHLNYSKHNYRDTTKYIFVDDKRVYMVRRGKLTSGLINILKDIYGSNGFTKHYTDDIGLSFPVISFVHNGGRSLVGMVELMNELEYRNEEGF